MNICEDHKKKNKNHLRRVLEFLSKVQILEEMSYMTPA